MRRQWERTKLKLCGYPQTRNRLTGELCLVGRYGEIWQYSETEYAAFISSPHAAKRISKIPNMDISIKRGEEAVVRFPTTQLNQICRALRIYKWLTHAIKAADEFGKNSDPDLDERQQESGTGSLNSLKAEIHPKSPQIDGGQKKSEPRHSEHTEQELEERF